MKEEVIMKKLCKLGELGILLAFAIAFSLLWGKTQVNAADVNGITVECYPNATSTSTRDKIELSAGKTANGITWDAANKVLTLNGYNGGAIVISASKDRTALTEIKVKILGSNTVSCMSFMDAEDYAFRLRRVDATFEGNGTLNIVGKNAKGYTRTLAVTGDLILNGPNIRMEHVAYPITVSKAELNISKDKKGNATTKEFGGSFVMKSGSINMDMDPYTNTTNKNGKKTVGYREAINTAESITITNGTIIVNLNGETGANNVTKPSAMIMTKGNLSAMEGTIIIKIDSAIGTIDTFYSTKGSSFVNVSNNVSIVNGTVLDISKVKITLSATSCFYNGTARKPAVVIPGLVNGADFTVAYKNNLNVGTATVTVTGKGKYTGKATTTFIINPAKKGTVLKSGNFKYKVTKAGTVKTPGTVAVIGATKKSLAKIEIKNVVNLGGVKYKISSIGQNAFKGFTKTKTLIIGANVTVVGANSFRNCKNLTNITIKSKKISKINANSFKGTKKTAVYKIPKARITKYTKLLKKAGASKTATYKQY